MRLSRQPARAARIKGDWCDRRSEQKIRAKPNGNPAARLEMGQTHWINEDDGFLRLHLSAASYPSVKSRLASPMEMT